MWLRLLSDRNKVMLEVWDNLPPDVLGAPVTKHADDDDESGRGLDMVEMLTEDWGWESRHGLDRQARLGTGVRSEPEDS